MAEKYDANIEKAYCAALLHDLGDSKYERGDEDFDAWSKEKGEEILLNAGFAQDEAEEIMEAVRTHGSRPGILQPPKKEKFWQQQMACGTYKPTSSPLSVT